MYFLNKKKKKKNKIIAEIKVFVFVIDEILAQRKTTSQHQTFLDVPTANMHHLRVCDDGDLDRLRTFSASKGGGKLE